MYMKVGDFWTLYIPYQSGYGSSTNDGNLQAYSALVYNVRLATIVERESYNNIINMNIGVGSKRCNTDIFHNNNRVAFLEIMQYRFSKSI